MGPLQGLRIVELFCIGPGPFAGMLLSDMGADILRIDRPQEPQLGYPDHKYRTLWRNRRAVQLDLGESRRESRPLLRLVEHADGLIEGYRPGVAERLGVGPDVCLKRNPRLVYGRMTGWGQEGPLRNKRDLTSITSRSLAPQCRWTGRETSTTLDCRRRLWRWRSVSRARYARRFVGSATFRAGQVVDASIVDGAANLMAYVYGGLAGGAWQNRRASNTVDGGHWRYGVYECADGKFVSVAAMMDPFLKVLFDKLGLKPSDFPEPNSRKNWPEYRERLAAIFRTRPRDEWVALFAGTDGCVAPVLDLEEAPQHPHNQARGTFVEHEGVLQPAPAPRFSRTPSEISRRPPANGVDTEPALQDWGFSHEELQGLRKRGAFG